MGTLVKHLENNGVSRCGQFASDDSFVVAALESDCNRCRATVFVGPMDQKGCALRPTSILPASSEETPKEAPHALKKS